jgi:23S rRNA pseudouridine2604 synthase
MEKGVQLEDCITKPCSVYIQGETSFRIILTEGKKHQIRRMVSAMHNEVADIKRIRIMNIKLGNMKPGEHRTIAGNELKEFLESLGLTI